MKYITLIGLLLLWSPVFGQPSNDECTNATVISSLPFTDVVNTATATSNPADPSLGCNGNGSQSDGNTVWYVWTPSTDTTVTISTIGSTIPGGNLLNTVIGVFTGTCGSLTQVACVDNGITDELIFEVTVGVTYYIKIGEFENGVGGGNLVVTVRAAGTLNTQGSVTVDGLTRAYIIYVPASYNEQTAIPLIINYHGFGSNMTSHMNTWTKMNFVADSAGFIVAYPQGRTVQDLILNDSRAGWHVPGTYQAAHDDIAFADSLIDKLRMEFNIDSSRIYATGWSNGGEMAFYLATKRPHRIASVASVSAPMSDSLLSTFNVERAFSAMLIHSTTDPYYPYDGIEGFFSPVQTTPSFWARHNGCSSDSAVTELPDLASDDGSTITRIQYTGCDENTEVLFYRVNNGGHGWPGAGVSFPWTGTTNQDINASAEVWNFFKRNPHPNTVTSVENIDNYPKTFALYANYPNPFNPSTKIIYNLSSPGHVELKIYNTLGQEIRTLVNSAYWAGTHQVSWDGRNNNGNVVSSGVYFYQLQAGTIVETRKMLLIR